MQVLRGLFFLLKYNSPALFGSRAKLAKHLADLLN
jgi:hypothetical protein